MKKLLSDLAKISDTRRKQGLRHSQANMLFLILLATLQGARGRRGIARFITNNSKVLIELLHPKSDKLPSASSIERTLNRVNSKSLSNVLHKWKNKVIELPEVLCLAGDGKSMRGTLQDAEGKGQNFVSILSFFETLTGQVVAVQPFENAQESEIHVFQQMILDSDFGQVILTGDAIHCQKKL